MSCLKGFSAGKEYKIIFALPENREDVAAVMQEGMSRFGGFTVTLGEGGWLNDVGEPMVEIAATVSIITDQHAGQVASWGHYLRDKLEQEEVIMVYPEGTAVKLRSLKL